MTEVSSTYQLAKHIHDSFYRENGLLTPTEIEESGIVKRPSHIYGTPQLTAFAEDGTERFRQSLSRAKDGTYYFSTVYSGEGGAVIIDRISPNSSLEKLEGLAGSIFMRALVRIAQDRIGMAGPSTENAEWVHRNTQPPKQHPLIEAIGL